MRYAAGIVVAVFLMCAPHNAFVALASLLWAVAAVFAVSFKDTMYDWDGRVAEDDGRVGWLALYAFLAASSAIYALHYTVKAVQ